MAKRLHYCCILSALLFRYANRESKENHTRGQEWKAKANCRQRQAETHALAPLQLCLLPNATVARWRCCLSTNQFTIDFFFGFSFLFCSFEKHKKCCNFEKQVPTRALLCAVAFRSVAALQLQLLLLLLFGIWLWNATKAQCARAPLSADVGYTWLQAAATVDPICIGEWVSEWGSVWVNACIPFLGTLIECVTS